MHDQFLTLKKSKNQAIGEADRQEDTVIDVRDFYPHKEEDDHYHDAFVLKHHKSEDKKNEK